VLRTKGDLEGSKAAFAEGAKRKAKSQEDKAGMLKMGMAGDRQH
jgi:hypothetical protein